MRVLVVDDAKREAWDAFVAGHPKATPFHRWAWMDAIRRAYGFAPTPLAAWRDGQVAGVLPLVRMRLPGLRGWLVSLPYCDCCGPLAEDAATRQALVDQALEQTRRQGAAGLELRQSRPEAGECAKVLIRMALPQGAQQLMASFRSKLRSQINKPKRDGLTAATGGMELLSVFYRVFSRNMRDLGSPVHSLDWFKAVLRGFEDLARVTVVAMSDGTPAAAAIWMVQGRTAFEPWASSLREHNRANPNMLLYWSMLSQAAAAGAEEFDMGRCTPGVGTHRFKLQWGGRELGLAWERFAPSGRRWPPAAKRSPGVSRRALAVCWSRLPLAVANTLGPALRRYISL
ncbi:GNAT family N-acetyltransferase [Solidesulfovibrio sp.]|uniref:GNAT family N-acetyltransferase n=1 Tax=Solidesulfovibrio sp. TaxID=2910990 RepID=UPI002604B69A|nr:GNAT family N-acetyltransferase [Solidesulfovibrio sp.]